MQLLREYYTFNVNVYTPREREDSIQPQIVYGPTNRPHEFVKFGPKNHLGPHSHSTGLK